MAERPPFVEPALVEGGAIARTDDGRAGAEQSRAPDASADGARVDDGHVRLLTIHRAKASVSLTPAHFPQM